MKKKHNGKIEDLGFGSLGNGTTVWDKTRERNGDYATAAHISDSGVLTWYELPLSDEQKECIEKTAIRMMRTFFVSGANISSALSLTSLYNLLRHWKQDLNEGPLVNFIESSFIGDEFELNNYKIKRVK